MIGQKVTVCGWARRPRRWIDQSATLAALGEMRVTWFVWVTFQTVQPFGSITWVLISILLEELQKFRVTELSCEPPETPPTPLDFFE